jgi:hypothetical protein
MLKIKISHKIALIIMFPILGFIYFSINVILEKQEIVNQMNLLQELSEIAIKSSALIHELQKERGLSAGLIGGAGKFFTELQMQRDKTDNAIKELYYLVISVISLNFKFLGNDIKNNLEISFAELNRIEDKRKRVNQLKLSVAEEISYYTKIVDSLLMGIKYLLKAITHVELSNQIVTYVNILQAKEKAGIERATLNNVFSRGYFAQDMYKKFILLVGLQEVYLKNFFFFASPSQRKYYIETMQTHDKLETEVKRIRTIAFNKAYKMQLVANLYVHLGYGGLIHQFKSYILRGETKYIDAFHQQYRKAFLLLAEYKKLPNISLSELKSIEILEKTFDTYKRHLTITVNMKSEQKTIKEIDGVIKIDDSIAFNALHDLENRGHLDIEPTDWWKVATGKINLLKTIEDYIASDLKASAMALKGAIPLYILFINGKRNDFIHFHAFLLFSPRYQQSFKIAC